MSTSKSKHNKLNMTSYEENKVENSWGFYVDIEKIKSNIPENHEIIRKKYNVKLCDDKFCEHCNDEEYNQTIKIQIDIYDENSKSSINKILRFIMSCIPTFLIINLLIYIIIFTL